jgi:hypothetical protein
MKKFHFLRKKYFDQKLFSLVHSGKRDLTTINFCFILISHFGSKIWTKCAEKQPICELLKNSHYGPYISKKAIHILNTTYYTQFMIYAVWNFRLEHQPFGKIFKGFVWIFKLKLKLKWYKISRNSETSSNWKRHKISN